MTANKPTGEGSILRDAYADLSDIAKSMASRLHTTLVIVRLEETLLAGNNVTTPTPHIHEALERMLRLVPNRALVAKAPKQKVIACLKQAGIVSDFRADHVFGDDGLNDQQMARGALYLQVAEQMGFFRQNVLVIEGSKQGYLESKYHGLKTLHYQAHGTYTSPDTFSTLAEFARLWVGGTPV